MRATVRMLGVHGVKNYQAALEPALAAQRLAMWWREAVSIGLSLPSESQHLFTMDIAYYAHQLHRHTAKAPMSLDCSTLKSKSSSSPGPGSVVRPMT